MKIERPIIALDFPNREVTLNFLKRFSNEKSLFVKIGMELYYSEGRQLVQEIIDLGHDVFLDLKLHDIPHTVQAAAKVLGKLGVKMITVHAAGGQEMMMAAKDGLISGSINNNVPKVLAITQLTSTSEDNMHKEQLINTSLEKSVLNYAKLAQKSGMDGVVCSAQEAKQITTVTSNDFLRVTPGIRLSGNKMDDQKRVMTPDQAAKQQSSAIVVGRAITQSNNPVETYELIKYLWENN
ncbi:MAG: orotidine-5'-phosphate decarboxylase [Firmicutes bacterium]|uniref:Orotidine 5'-phosphate decarboxylase n=1 Tax=Candidatus Gallilactobacillus intestinavium TaxID=2840838 RepID=A0A9D9H5S1_9LACO|nr:orotidine-5'-phosphate decarboxylase [Candidatus Gallilactobacillus intestinavium]